VLAAGRFNSGPILLNGTARTREQAAFQMLGATTLSAGAGTARGSGTGRILMVSSAEANAGKTTVVANLAGALARAGYQVAVVDADLKHPTLHRIFGIEGKPGLKEVLAGAVSAPLALRESRVSRVKVMPSGASDAGSELLMNPVRVRQLLQQLAQEADLVLVDSPAVLDSADPAALSLAMDGVLLVVVRGESTEDEVQRGLAHLQRAGAKNLGLVMNKSREG
jgi:capsular exopolysaccharide synthesis family protein